MSTTCIPFPELARKIMEEKWNLEQIENYIEEEIKKYEKTPIPDCTIWNIVFLEDILENPDFPVEIVREEYREVVKELCRYVKSLKNRRPEMKKEETCVECGRKTDTLGICFRCRDCCEKRISECWRVYQCKLGREVLSGKLEEIRIKTLDEDDGYPD